MESLAVTPNNMALSHLKVLDLSRVRAGPTACRQLSDWGADVLMIEHPTDDGGLAGPGGRKGSDFQNLHRNKRSMTLDLKTPQGIEILKKLVESADVLIENFRPDVKTRLGIDYASLRPFNPRLVYASISGFGQTGPYASRPGIDQIAQGMGGLMSLTGYPEGQPGAGPLRVGIPIADLCAGLFAAMGILVALQERERSGLGQFVETSLLTSQLFMLDFQSARWLMDGVVPEPCGNFHPTDARTGTFRTADGYIVVGAWGDSLWKRFCDAIDAPEMIPLGAELAIGPNRAINLPRFVAEVEKRLASKGSVEWVELLNKAGVPSGPIYTLDQAFADPQVKHLGIVQSVESATRGTLNMVGQPWTLSRTPSALRSAAPSRGEHCQEVLQQLGYTAQQFAELKVAGVI
jgi:crotonobetainyl-CoA:carnitine CoA-transferase CaiB-like acyl-CoA transferase